MKNITLLNSLAEIILMIIFPYVATIWAWGWWWLPINLVIFCFVVSGIWNYDIHKYVYAGIILLYLFIPTIALIRVCSVNPIFWFVPYLYYLICVFLVLKR